MLFFVVAYGSKDTVSSTRKHNDIFWVDLDSVVSRVSSSDYRFVSIDDNACIGVRIGEKYCKVIGAYGRNTRPVKAI